MRTQSYDDYTSTWYNLTKLRLVEGQIIKKLLIIGLFLATSLFADLNWADDYESALTQAKEEKKIVMIMFSLTECHVCKQMKKNVYTNPEVMAYVEKYFVPVELNLDIDDKEGYAVFGTPTFYFLTSEGKQIGDVKVGGSTLDGFKKKLKEVRAGK